MIGFLDVKTDKDIVLLADLANEIWHEYWVDLLCAEQINYMINKFQSESAIKEQIKKENYVYKIIKKDGEIIGYLGVCPKEEYLFLSKLYIKAGSRGKGIGRTALELIKQLAKEHGKSSIILTVNKYNTNTIAAYKKWGFLEKDATVTDIGSGFVMDDYIMEFKL